MEPPYKKDCSQALCTYIRTYSLFKSEQFSTNIRLTHYKAVIRSLMTYVCPTWEYTLDTRLLKLQCWHNRVLRPIGNVDRCTPVHKLHATFKIPYVCDYATKLRRTQAEVILNHVNPNVHCTGQGAARCRQYKRLKLGGGQAYDCSAD
jgi:hypothetical protein